MVAMLVRKARAPNRHVARRSEDVEEELDAAEDRERMGLWEVEFWFPVRGSITGLGDMT